MSEKCYHHRMVEYTYISLPEDLGRDVRAARNDRGLTQTELAR